MARRMEKLARGVGLDGTGLRRRLSEIAGSKQVKEGCRLGSQDGCVVTQKEGRMKTDGKKRNLWRRRVRMQRSQQQVAALRQKLRFLGINCGIY